MIKIKFRAIGYNKKVGFGKEACTKSKKNKFNRNDSTRVSSIDDDDLVINDVSSDGDGWIPEDDEELQPDYNKIGRNDDFALVKFPNKVFYIGKRLSNMEGEGDYEISYMRKT
ncbi:hypothetical protein JTB14_017468 [Gonioctena quinquepunctata]|nr:hypothetical protein JTB14_017468 [Gonioctena quinquepunctata]